jgi:hypothetical protein
VPRRLTILVAVALCAAAPPAGAFPFLTIHPSGTPFEGPADFEPSGIWWNPATISAIRHLNLYFSGGVQAQQGSIQRAAIDPMTGLPGPGATRSFPSVPLNDVSFRYFGAITYDFGLDVLTAGLALSAPFDSSQSFPDNGSGSSLALPTGYHVASENFKDIYISIALALRLHPRWLIGVAISPIDSFVDFAYYRDSALDGGSPQVNNAGTLCHGAPCGFENPSAATRVQVHADGGSFLYKLIPVPLGIGMNWGIATRPVERMWLGLSWQHVFPLQSHGSGYDKSYEVPSEMQVTVTPASGSGISCAGGACTGPGSIAFSLPDIFHLGARIALRDDLEVTGGGRLIIYGGYGSSDPALKNLVVRVDAQGGVPEQTVMARSLHPVFGAEGGVRWRPIPSLRVGLSLTVESSALPGDLVTAEAIDAPKFDATAGVEWKIHWKWRNGGALRLILAYGITSYFPSEPSPGAFDPGARVRCIDARSSIDACGPDLAGQGLPTAAGRYTLLLHHATAGIGLEF